MIATSRDSTATPREEIVTGAFVRFLASNFSHAFCSPGMRD